MWSRQDAPSKLKSEVHPRAHWASPRSRDRSRVCRQGLRLWGWSPFHSCLPPSCAHRGLPDRPGKAVKSYLLKPEVKPLKHAGETQGFPLYKQNPH